MNRPLQNNAQQQPPPPESRRYDSSRKPVHYLRRFRSNESCHSERSEESLCDGVGYKQSTIRCHNREREGFAHHHSQKSFAPKSTDQPLGVHNSLR